MGLKNFGMVRLTKDPELRRLPSGTAVCNFNAVYNDRYKEDDEWKESPVWLRCTVWGSRAEVIDKYLNKGSLLCITDGSLISDRSTGNPRIWFDDAGEPHTQFEIKVTDFEFAGGKSDSPGKGKDEEEIPWD